MNLLKKLVKLQKFRWYSMKKDTKNIFDKIRNIGVLAHIDAGKTTTTERMLYYSGLIQQIGEVHHGNTVTDFMSQERERGITITSASVTYLWNNYQFNLIDTPGHIDFTMEVEQSLNVLDGAIIVLDGSAGVEAQTLTVWRQTESHRIPRIVFINKMDRFDSNLIMCEKSLKDKLEIQPLLLQLPIKDEHRLIGLVDLVNMQTILYDKNDIRQIYYNNLDKNSDLWKKSLEARSQLIDTLCGYDDIIADLVIKLDSFENVKSQDVIKSIRKLTIEQRAVPLLIGSAYKNIGIQPLMDSVIYYLPSPLERNILFSNFDKNLCARAFKIRHDRQKGPLVFFRIYNGKIEKSQRIYNIQEDKSEQIVRLYQAFADEFKETEQITNGNIAVVSGLKYIKSGDLITNNSTTAQKAKVKMIKSQVKDEEIQNLFSNYRKIPEPVFLCSIEAPSMAYEASLEQALNELQREDPSLKVIFDEETGQTILGGMGELHLEIIKERIIREYKIEVELGSLQIAYRESPINTVRDSSILDTKIGNTKQMVNVELSLIPTILSTSNEVLKLDKNPESASNISAIFPKHFLAIRQGILTGLSRGPKISSQVVNAQIMLHWCEVGRGTSESVIEAAVTKLIQKLLKMSTTNILEPIMYLDIVCPEEYLSAVLADLGRRRSVFHDVGIRGKMKMINVEVPLAELKGYATVLRTLSSGTATFTMQFNEYQIMSPDSEDNAIKNVRGF